MSLNSNNTSTIVCYCSRLSLQGPGNKTMPDGLTEPNTVCKIDSTDSVLIYTLLWHLPVTGYISLYPLKL